MKMIAIGDLPIKHERNALPHLPRRRLALLGALVLAWPILASADCTLRPTRAAETEFNSRAMAALVAAFPPAPAGVTTVVDRPFDFKKPPGIYAVLCEGTKEGEFSITTRRQYIRKHSEAERKYWSAQYDAVTAEFHALKKLPPEKEAEEKALRQQSNAAYQAMRDAEKAGDKAAAKERDAEYRALRNQADGVETQHRESVKAQTSELDKRRIAIELERQTAYVVLSMNLQRLPAARTDNSSGAYGAASRGMSAGLQMHNVSFSVDGVNGVDGSLRQALSGAIDSARLQALVGKPLPSVAQSEAYAAAAVAVTVPDIAMDGMPAAPVSSASTGASPPSPSSSSAPAPAPAPAPARQAAAAPKPPGPAADPLKKGLEAVNMLRGLLGR